MAKKWRIGVLNYRESLFDIIAKSIRSEGHELSLFNLENQSWEACRDFLEKSNFDFLVTGNFVAFHLWKHGPELEAYLSDRNRPCIIWHWEKVFFSGNAYLKERLERASIKSNFIFLVTDKSDITVLKSYGISAKYLPLGVDDDLVHFRPSEFQKKQFSHALGFSGTPFKLEAVQASDLVNLRRGFVANTLLEFYSRAQAKFKSISMPRDLNATALQIVNEVYESLPETFQEFRAAFSRAHQSFGSAAGSEWANLFENYQSRLAYIYSHFQLCVYLTKLSEFDVRISGSDLWNLFIPHYRHPSARLSESDFYGLLACSKITFCLTKLQFDNFLHERSMMTLACGGFPITDFREVVREHFEPDELVTYSSFDEAQDRIRHFLRTNSERSQITERGRARVFKEHLYKFRVRSLVQIASDAF